VEASGRGEVEPWLSTVVPYEQCLEGLGGLGGLGGLTGLGRSLSTCHVVRDSVAECQSIPSRYLPN